MSCNQMGSRLVACDNQCPIDALGGIHGEAVSFLAVCVIVRLEAGSVDNASMVMKEIKSEDEPKKIRGIAAPY